MRSLHVLILAFVFAATACGGGGPDAQSLRDSFAQQLQANKFVTNFQRSGDEMTFSGPNPDGGTANWKVRIDSAVIEPNSKPEQPYKGTIKSSWTADGQPVVPKGSESNLPLELMSNGLTQDCWAFWEQGQNRWGWE
ncbi:MAG: hypothetical protein FJW27_06260 [Acidimicrobiia bacterium]|nr:hypothetical protein [Acidimicrobiia bacterium]